MKRTLIIAEAGVNHNGSLEIAKELIDVAAKAGVDYVKFQTFKADKLVSKSAQKAEYQSRNIGNGDNSQLSMLKKLELSIDDHLELIEYCNNKGIKFFSTAFDSDSIILLNSLGLEIWKIPSGELTNYPYLRDIAKLNKPIILSTGMADIEEIQNSIDVLLKYGSSLENITLLHCTTEYPAPIDQVNLNAIKTLRDRFNVNVGYSDHTEGINIPIAAVAIGATIIEKHFTLNKQMEGPDHKASLEPNELISMCKAIRDIEKALGNGIKVPCEAELKNIVIARKSIVAACDIKKGEKFNENNITTKRPANGISPMMWNDIIGKIATKEYKEEQLIEL